MPAKPSSITVPREPPAEVKEGLTCAATSSRLAKGRSRPRLRRSAPATAWKRLEDVRRFATVGEVLSKLGDKPNYSTVRAQLRVLEEKGHVRHEEQGLRYV